MIASEGFVDALKAELARLKTELIRETERLAEVTREKG